MKKSYTAILVLTIIANCAFSQEPVVKTITVLEDSLYNPVEMAYMGKSSSGVTYATNETGVLNIAVSPGDSLFFRCLGYQDSIFVIKDEHMVFDTLFFAVSKKYYELSEVKVMRFSSYAAFKLAATTMKLPEEKDIIG